MPARQTLDDGPTAELLAPVTCSAHDDLEIRELDTLYGLSRSPWLDLKVLVRSLDVVSPGGW